jgi:hypothetical protein
MAFSITFEPMDIGAVQDRDPARVSSAVSISCGERLCGVTIDIPRGQVTARCARELAAAIVACADEADRSAKR